MGKRTNSSTSIVQQNAAVKSATYFVGQIVNLRRIVNPPVGLDAPLQVRQTRPLHLSTQESSVILRRSAQVCCHSRRQALTSILANDMLRQMIRKRITSLFLAALPALAQLPPLTQDAIDAAVKKTLAASGVASASIAVVRDAKIAYAHAYGDARLDPRTPATSAMRYKIGSNTKQFTATAVLLLCEQGKLSLDDSVAKYFPGLTRANQIAIRQLLSHTSGYEDYYPLDYVAPFMARKTTPQAILDTGREVSAVPDSSRGGG
jgi:CubicO group peptidase (beta-lactamase class C family)